MFALVESGSITSYHKGNRGIQIGDIKHSSDIFTTKWTESERNAIGVYTVEEDNTNWKNPYWYINTDMSFAYDASSNKVKGTYGTATAKAIEDVLYTQADEDNGLGTKDDIKEKHLKTILKEDLDGQCKALLQPSDYMAIKAAEGITMNSGWKTWRANVRTKCNSMQTQIDNAANIDALAALYVYVNTADEGEPEVLARPLGEFPVKG